MPNDRRTTARWPSFALAGIGLLVALLLRATPPPAAADVTPELQAKINAAVDKGAAWLLKQRNIDGSFPPVILNHAPMHIIGTTSLCSLALLAAQVPKKDPGFVQTLSYLKGEDTREGSAGVRSTYGMGCLIMFLTEYYRPTEEKKEKPKKEETIAGKPRVNPCSLPKDIQAWIQDLADTLVSKQLDSGGWRYPMVPPADLSNTQYALLGLRAARDCGSNVPASCFEHAMEFALTLQEADGPKVKRRMPGGGKPGEIDYVIEAGDKARGFGYQANTNQITGSMTTAGIADLAICRDALLRPRFAGFTDEMDRKIKRDVQDGFAWLDKNFAVDKNPPPGSGAWHYYYLYGLERACAFGDRDRVGTHDWYAEGAAYLVSKQLADGSWSTGALGAQDLAASDYLDTSWALLFLKKATRPVIPVPAPVITGG